MKEHVDQAELGKLRNFPALMEPIMEYIRETWEGNLLPKGYEEYLEDYEEYKGMGTRNERKAKNAFNGVSDDGVSYPFPVRISKPHVAYDDREQGRDPLETLVGAIFAYGLIIGDARTKKKITKDNEARHERWVEKMSDLIEENKELKEKLKNSCI